MAAKCYSITELELCGLAINIASFAHLLKRVDFDAIVDHLALTHIIKSKVETATTTIKRLLELISPYSFNLYYMKGKDIILSDFLSWQKNDDSNASEIIPISFNTYSILENNRNIGICKDNDEKYLIQTHSQAKSSSTKLPEVHGARKELNPNLRPEKQHAMPKRGISEKPQVGKGRAGLRRRPEPDCINQPSDVTQGIPGGSKIETGKTNSSQGKNGACDRAVNNSKLFMPDVPLHLDPLHKPSSLQQNANKINQNPNINLDFEENSPFQEGIISETIQRLDKTFFFNPKELDDLIGMENLIHRILPKQTDIDKILQIIQRKVLKDTQLPVEVKEIQAGYLHNSYFKDIYQYLLQNKTPEFQNSHKEIRGIIRKVCIARFLIVQHSSRKRDSSSGNTLNMCRQDNNSVSQKSICRSSRSN